MAGISIVVVIIGMIMLYYTLLQDYYRILEVDYDASDDEIRSNYIRLALVYLSFIRSLLFCLLFGFILLIMLKKMKVFLSIPFPSGVLFELYFVTTFRAIYIICKN